MAHGDPVPAACHRQGDSRAALSLVMAVALAAGSTATEPPSPSLPHLPSSALFSWLL